MAISLLVAALAATLIAIIWNEQFSPIRPSIQRSMTWMGVQMDPPGPSEKTRISETEALSLCHYCFPDQVVLANVTTPGFTDWDGNHRLHPVWDHRLAWVIIGRPPDTECPRPPVASDPTLSPGTSPCASIEWVDASTGHVSDPWTTTGPEPQITPRSPFEWIAWELEIVRH